MSKLSDYKVVKGSDMCIRRIERDGVCVALIMRYSNGRWGVFEPNGSVEIVSGSFNAPKDALAAYVEGGTDAGRLT